MQKTRPRGRVFRFETVPDIALLGPTPGAVILGLDPRIYCRPNEVADDGDKLSTAANSRDKPENDVLA
jgi:hypothetical protein